MLDHFSPVSMVVAIRSLSDLRRLSLVGIASVMSYLTLSETSFRRLQLPSLIPQFSVPSFILKLGLPGLCMNVFGIIGLLYYGR